MTDTTQGAPNNGATAPGPLEATHAEWVAAKAFCNSVADMDSPEYEAAFGALMAIERRAQELRPATMREYAFKILIADDDGNMSASSSQDALVAEARALIEETA